MKVTLEFCPKKFARLSRRSVLSVGLFAVVALISGCPQPATSAAEVSYTSALASCAATAKTLEESRMCREDVNDRFGLCHTDAGLVSCTDGGVDGSR